MEKRRHIIATFLLAVLLPAFIVSFLHSHPEYPADEHECEECLHHHPHAGHIVAGSGSFSDCVLCHFLGIPFIATLAAAFLPSARRLNCRCAFLHEACVEAFRQINLSRAPPVFPFD